MNTPDLPALLDQWPGWRTLTEELPNRIAALEERVARLEGATVRPKTLAPALCPDCREEMLVLRESDHPQLSFRGVKIHELRCKGCSAQFTRQFNPRTGYGL
jgi:hypothetical protein